jgi:hypothetical protein
MSGEGKIVQIDETLIGQKHLRIIIRKCPARGWSGRLTPEIGNERRLARKPTT